MFHLLILLILLLGICAVDGSDEKADQKDQNYQEDDYDDNYFMKLLEQESNEKHEEKNESKEVTLDKNDSPEMSFLKKYGINSERDLKNVQMNDPIKYMKIQTDLMSQNLEQVQSQKLAEFEQKLNIQKLLVKVEGEGYNSKDFAAFCQYNEIKASDKAFELYKKSTNKPNKSKFDDIKKQADIQSKGKDEIMPDKAKDIKVNDYESRAHKIAGII